MSLHALTDDDLQRALCDGLDAEDWGLVDRLELECDRRDRYTPPCPGVTATLAQAAAWYATQGLAVFPLRPGSKIPYPGSHGFHDATTDIDQIATWWAAAPESNIGIATGGLVDVADLDGWDAQDRWAQLDEVPTPYGIVVTPRHNGGGRHLYVPATGRGNATGMLAARIDWRGAGGYVVAPPSRLPEGHYWWRQPLNLARQAA